MNNKQIVKQIPLFIFAIILFAVTLIMLKVVNPFYVYLIIWFIVAPLVIYQWANIMKSIGNMMFNGRYKHTEQMPKITFLIATKHCPEFVQQSIDSVTNSCNKLNFTNYEVKVVTEVKDRFRKKENVKEVLVPASYVCTSKYKARALNYALSYLPNSKEEWIFHMDEDTRIIPQTIKSIMNFIKKEGDKHQIANGLSVFTENKNLLTFYAEAQRMWTYMWLMQQTKKTPVWMNGSNMLIRSDIEQSIGWDFNASINEDTIFVYYAHKKYGNIFGWHGGLTIELSAKNVKSLINQRKKWFYGSFTTILECPRNVRILRAYSSIAWILGFLMSIFFVFNLFAYHIVIWPLALAFAVFACLWLIRFQIGMFYMLKYNETNLSSYRKALHHLGLLLLSPVIDMICNSATVFGILLPPQTFEITEK